MIGLQTVGVSSRGCQQSNQLTAVNSYSCQSKFKLKHSTHCPLVSAAAANSPSSNIFPGSYEAGQSSDWVGTVAGQHRLLDTEVRPVTAVATRLQYIPHPGFRLGQECRTSKHQRS